MRKKETQFEVPEPIRSQYAKEYHPEPPVESSPHTPDTCRRAKTEEPSDILGCDADAMALVQFFRTLDRWAREADATADVVAENLVAAATGLKAGVSVPHLVPAAQESRRGPKLASQMPAGVSNVLAREVIPQSDYG